MSYAYPNLIAPLPRTRSLVATTVKTRSKMSPQPDWQVPQSTIGCSTGVTIGLPGSPIPPLPGTSTCSRIGKRVRFDLKSTEIIPQGYKENNISFRVFLCGTPYKHDCNYGNGNASDSFARRRQVNYPCDFSMARWGEVRHLPQSKSPTHEKNVDTFIRPVEHKHLGCQKPRFPVRQSSFDSCTMDPPSTNKLN